MEAAGAPLVRLPASPAAVRAVSGVVPALLRHGDVVVELAGPGRADLHLLDALARLTLAARDRPGALRVRGADPGVRGLARLTGLSATLGLDPPER